jgi:hypothetical protein
MKMINPIIKAVRELINTAAADKSFTFFIVSCLPGEIKSAKCSMDELIISKVKTIPMDKTIAIQSIADSLSRIPEVTTRIVTPR